MTSKQRNAQIVAKGAKLVFAEWSHYRTLDGRQEKAEDDLKLKDSPYVELKEDSTQVLLRVVTTYMDIHGEWRGQQRNQVLGRSWGEVDGTLFYRLLVIAGKDKAWLVYSLLLYTLPKTGPQRARQAKRWNFPGWQSELVPLAYRHAVWAKFGAFAPVAFYAVWAYYELLGVFSPEAGKPEYPAIGNVPELTRVAHTLVGIINDSNFRFYTEKEVWWAVGVDDERGVRNELEFMRKVAQRVFHRNEETTVQSPEPYFKPARGNFGQV